MRTIGTPARLIASFFAASVFHCSLAQERDAGARPDGSVAHDVVPKDCAEYTNYSKTENYSVVSAKCGDQYTIWLLRNKSHVSSSYDFEVIDQKTVRTLRPGELFVSGPFCYDRSNKEVFLSAIMRWTGKKRLQHGGKVIIEAWVPEIRRGRLVPMSNSIVKSIRCSVRDDE